MKTDIEIQNDIGAEFLSNEGVTQRIGGIKSFCNSLKTKMPESSDRGDGELKKNVLSIIKWNSSNEDAEIEILVKHGWVTIMGNVAWDFQRSKAELLAKDITGVVGVTNNIIVLSDHFG